MQFGINWRDGYEVCVLMTDERGMRRWYPLRNFGDRQGDARIFKEVDCPELTTPQLNMLIKHFDRRVKYIRITAKKFMTSKSK